MSNPLVSIIEEDVRGIVDSVSMASLQGKSLLLTGASGLLGTYFLASLRELSRRGLAPSQVVAMVHSPLSAPTTLFSDFPELKIVHGDLTAPGTLDHMGRFDFIIHAAGYGQPGKFMDNQVKTLALNTQTTLSLFEHLSEQGHFLYLSSSEVYSGLGTPPYAENQIGSTNTNHPRSCYIEGKRCGEAICNAYRARGVTASSARLALAYGPGTKPSDHRVLNAFIQRSLTTGRLTLQDSGAAMRTYCYVAEAVEILWHILLQGKHAIYNVGGTSRTSIADLAKSIGRHIAVPVEFPQTEQALGGAPDDVYLDMARVMQEFGKDTFIPLEAGLQRTIQWQTALYGIPPHSMDSMQ